MSQRTGIQKDVSAQACPAFTKMFPARGLAVRDYDNDGRLDVLVGNYGQTIGSIRAVSRLA